MLLSKRDFVKHSAAAGIVVGLADDSAAANTLPLTRLGFDVVVYNDLYREARAFAGALAAQNPRMLAIAGDPGRLWYGTLRSLVAGGSRRLAGMTTHTDLLILETLARDQGLKVRYRARAQRLVSWVLT